MFSSIKDYELEYSLWKIGFDDTILHQRYRKALEQAQLIESFYTHTYDNCSVIKSELSKWGVFHLARELVLNNVQRKMALARSMVTQVPCSVAQFGLT